MPNPQIFSPESIYPYDNFTNYNFYWKREILVLILLVNEVFKIDRFGGWLYILIAQDLLLCSAVLVELGFILDEKTWYSFYSEVSTIFHFFFFFHH